MDLWVWREETIGSKYKQHETNFCNHAYSSTNSEPPYKQGWISLRLYTHLPRVIKRHTNNFQYF